MIHPGEEEFARLGEDERLALQYTHFTMNFFERLYLLHRDGVIDDQRWKAWESWIRYLYRPAPSSRMSGMRAAGCIMPTLSPMSRKTSTTARVERLIARSARPWVLHRRIGRNNLSGLLVGVVLKGQISDRGPLISRARFVHGREPPRARGSTSGGGDPGGGRPPRQAPATTWQGRPPLLPGGGERILAQDLPGRRDGSREPLFLLQRQSRADGVPQRAGCPPHPCGTSR